MSNSRSHQPVLRPALILLFAISFTQGHAAAADVKGPVSGWVFDPAARAISPVLGIPGASTMGDALDLGFTLSHAAIAPSQEFLLAVSEDGAVHLVRPAATSSQKVETLHGAPSRIVFSPRGTAALFVNRDTVDVYAGLPDKPALARTLNTAVIGSPSALAVSDDGIAVLAAADNAVRLSTESGEWRTIESGGAHSVAFAPASRDAVIAGPGGSVVLFRDLTTSAERIAIELDGNARPQAVALTSDGRIFLAGTPPGAVTVVDPKTSARSIVACDCSPVALSRMGSFFRLTEFGGAPLWLLDTAAAEPRTLFIPALAKRSEEE